MCSTGTVLYKLMYYGNKLLFLILLIKLSRSLSATLEMDPVDNMNLSWTSSLATPPEHAERIFSICYEDLQGNIHYM